MSSIRMDQTSAMAEAREKGYRILRGNPRRLLLDLDDEEAYRWFKQNFDKFADQLKQYHDLTMEVVDEWTSKSGEGIHVKIKLSRPLPLTSRLLLQACLGSDLVKEFLSLRRKWLGFKEPSLLFRPRAKVHQFPKRQPQPVDDTWGVTDDEVPF